MNMSKFLSVISDPLPHVREKLALLVPSHSKFISCFGVPLLYSIVLFHRTDLRETNVSRNIIWWQTRNKAVTDPGRLFWNCAP